MAAFWQDENINKDNIILKKSKMSYIRTDTIGSFLKKTKPTEFRYRINFYKRIKEFIVERMPDRER